MNQKQAAQPATETPRSPTHEDITNPKPKRFSEKIVILAILEKTLSPSVPMKQQLNAVASDVAAKLKTDSVRVIKM